ncbi:uncharacterized protein ACJ7VT_002385 [Polymixia lowei]
MVNGCCVLQCRNRCHDRYGNRIGDVRFFSFPVWKRNKGAEISELTKRRRMAWVAAVRRAKMTFKSKTRNMFVCSRHFHTGKPACEKLQCHPDWVPSLHLGHKEVKPTHTERFNRRIRREQALGNLSEYTVVSVPSPQKTEETVSDATPHHSQDSHSRGQGEDAETLGEAGAFFADVHSTPMKSKVSKSSIGQSELHSRLKLMLMSPEQTEELTCPSMSGTYHALPPTCAHQMDIQAQTEQETLEQSSAQDTSTASVDVPPDPKDFSFVPQGSISTSHPATATEEEKELGQLNERKWLVNESKLMELFKTCHQCGGGILEPRTDTVGSLIRVNWKCTNGHSGQWSSCPDIPGVPENSLIMAAYGILTQTDMTYTHIHLYARKTHSNKYMKHLHVYL